MLDCITLDPPSPATACVIWMHGLGADGNDFVPIVPELNLPRDHGVRFVFPNAPTIPVTINGGYVMRAWYDIVSAELDKRADEAGVRRSQALIAELIAEQQRQGIAADRDRGGMELDKLQVRQLGTRPVRQCEATAVGFDWIRRVPIELANSTRRQYHAGCQQTDQLAAAIARMHADDLIADLEQALA
mgnify:CR=1 FL=1